MQAGSYAARVESDAAFSQQAAGCNRRYAVATWDGVQLCCIYTSLHGMPPTRVAVVERREAHNGRKAAISYGRGQLSAKSFRVDACLATT